MYFNLLKLYIHYNFRCKNGAAPIYFPVITSYKFKYALALLAAFSFPYTLSEMRKTFNEIKSLLEPYRRYVHFILSKLSCLCCMLTNTYTHRIHTCREQQACEYACKSKTGFSTLTFFMNFSFSVCVCMLCARCFFSLLFLSSIFLLFYTITAAGNLNKFFFNFTLAQQLQPQHSASAAAAPNVQIKMNHSTFVLFSFFCICLHEWILYYIG